MSIKPILFNTEMVRAILDGRKTVTRRVVKCSHRGAAGFNIVRNHSGDVVGIMDYDDDERMYDDYTQTPYRPGDILYGRETWCPYYPWDIIDGAKYAYKANATAESERCRRELGYKWRPSIHMPREAARIWLRVTDVRVELLQEITAESAIAEGVVGAILPSIRHKEKQSKWCSGFCSECVHFDLEAGLAKDNCPGDYEAQKPRNGTSVGCTFGFDLKPDTAYEPPIFQFQQLWDKAALKSKNCISWSQNPWVWVIAFERCEKPEVL